MFFKALKRIRFLIAVSFAAAAGASCGGDTGSGAFTAPEFLKTEADVVRLSVTLSCSLSSERVDACGFTFGKEDSGSLTDLEAALDGKDFELTLKGLDPATTYKWAAYIKSGRFTVKSEWKSFTTDESALPKTLDQGPIDPCEMVYKASGKLFLDPGLDNFSSEVIYHEFKDGIGAISFDAPLTWIAEMTFWENESLIGLHLPSGLKHIGYSAFRECPNLTEVYFDDGIETIGDSSFHHNEKLSVIRLPSTLRVIEKDAFSHCYDLREIDIPEGVERLEQSAFLSCTKLRSIVLPATIKELGIYAFDNDTALEYVKVLATIPPKGNDRMFSYNADYPIYVPAESLYAYKEAPYWSNYARRIKPIDNQ
jgi:hypothetical protein